MVTRRDPGMETCLCSSLLVFPVACRVLKAIARGAPRRGRRLRRGERHQLDNRAVGGAQTSDQVEVSG